MPIGQIGWNTFWLDLHGLFMFTAFESGVIVRFGLPRLVARD